MDYKGALLGWLEKTTKKSHEELASLLENEDGEGLKDDALDNLLAWDVDRVSGLKMPKEDQTKLFDDGFKKGQSQSLKKFENTLKEEYTFESESTGIDLVNAIVKENTKADPSGGEPKEVTIDDVRKHKTFIDEQEKWKGELAKTNDEWKTKFDFQKNEFESTRIFGQVRERADSVINSLNPLFSTDPAKASKQRSVIHKELEQYKFEIQENRTVVLDAEGKVLNDPHEQRVEFGDLVKNITTSIYDLKASNPRESGGGTGGSGSGSGIDPDITAKYEFAIPKNAEDYMNLMSKTTDVKERGEITKAWQEVKQSTN